MNLIQYILEKTRTWADVFPQTRTLERAITVAVGILGGVGKRTITRAIGFNGNTQKDWSADYKLFSRSPWEPRELFNPILQCCIKDHQLNRIVVSSDDTRVWRTGQHVPQTQWHRDPMGPPFQTNLRWGHRFLQASLVLPLYKQDGVSSSRSIPIRWEMAPTVKKPGKNATQEQLDQYHRLKKQTNLSVQFVALTKELRSYLDQSGHSDKRLYQVVDGSFCNQTVFSEDWDSNNVSIIARARKDLILCRRVRKKGSQFYSKTKFTPEMVRQQDSLAKWQSTQIFHGGCYRNVRYKEITGIYWQRGAKKRPLRLIVLAPTGYRTTKNGRTYYRKPAYLLTNDLTTPTAILIQDYFDRWGIEVNHRDEKEILGVGEAQVWNENSVTKVPALLVAMYSWLLLAGLNCYGPTRTNDYDPLPKWRSKAKRPSCLDLVRLLRRQLAADPIKFPTGEKKVTQEAMLNGAAA